MALDYTAKFQTFVGRTLYDSLARDQRDFVRVLAFAHRLTFQEFREVSEASRDLALWSEEGLESWWTRRNGTGGLHKDHLLRDLRAHMVEMRRRPKSYAARVAATTLNRPSKPVVTRETDKTIAGLCPVASPRTVCCNLRTIDAVENCVFGCSYCSVQTFYRDEIVFDSRLAEKLNALSIDPDRFYHFGTGQASDSLAWGNKGGVLDAMCEFAARHPNILLEFKTKSDNTRYFLENDVPANVVCSWSMNTPAVIDNEEHFTASFERRVAAARQVAGRGVRVAFHFHPMVYYEGWRDHYTAAAQSLVDQFDPREVAFLSLGSVTLIKPVIQSIRKLGNPTKITQMQLVPDPHGKLTYPDDIKVEMFTAMKEAFAPWEELVFMYLCMEKSAIWERVLGRAYPDNESFERDFGRRTLTNGRRPPRTSTIGAQGLRGR